MIREIKKAFTLAEMLVTIVIIGVIAAITIPALQETTDMASNVALMKKAYSTASHAFSQIQSELGSPIYWTVQNSGDESIEGKRVFSNENASAFAWLLKKKIIVANEKIPNSYSIKMLSGTEFTSGSKIDETVINLGGENSVAFQSTDGMYWFPSQTYSGCRYEKPGQLELNGSIPSVQPGFGGGMVQPPVKLNLNILGLPAFAGGQNLSAQQYMETVYLCGLLMVDINGAQKPNRIGVDVFVFDVTTSGIMPHTSEEDDCADLNGTGYSCAAKAMIGDEHSLDFIYE